MTTNTVTRGRDASRGREECGPLVSGVDVESLVIEYLLILCPGYEALGQRAV